jgi:hypothetical protein
LKIANPTLALRVHKKKNYGNVSYSFKRDKGSSDRQGVFFSIIGIKKLKIPLADKSYKTHTRSSIYIGLVFSIMFPYIGIPQTLMVLSKSLKQGLKQVKLKIYNSEDLKCSILNRTKLNLLVPRNN